MNAFAVQKKLLFKPVKSFTVNLRVIVAKGSLVIKLLPALKIDGKIYVGDKIIEEKIGRKVRWDVQFSKTSPAFQTGEYDLYFRGDFVGVDSVADLVDTAESLGLVERTGAWYSVDGHPDRVQGRDKLVALVKSSGEVMDNLLKKVENV